MFPTRSHWLLLPEFLCFVDKCLQSALIRYPVTLIRKRFYSQNNDRPYPVLFLFPSHRAINGRVFSGVRNAFRDFARAYTRRGTIVSSSSPEVSPCAAFTFNKTLSGAVGAGMVRRVRRFSCHISVTCRFSVRCRAGRSGMTSRLSTIRSVRSRYASRCAVSVTRIAAANRQPEAALLPERAHVACRCRSFKFCHLSQPADAR